MLYIFISLISLISFNLNAEVVEKITVRGNSRISAEAIEFKIKNKVGNHLNEEILRDDIKNIFDLGYFDNIVVYKNASNKGIELIYDLKEKPIIRNIVFEGNSDVSESDLKEAIDVKSYTVLNISNIKKAKEAILKLYEEKGYYLATVTEELTPAEADEDIDEATDFLDLKFKILENDKIKVKKITLLGNKQIHDDEIKAFLDTREESPFSFFTGSGSYRESTVEIDKEKIAFYYGTKGFPHIRVSGPITSITPDKKWIYITYKIEEGDKYKLGDIDFKTNDILYTEEELREKLILKKDEVFNSLRIREQMLTYQNLYGDKGYAFTNVIPMLRYDTDEKVAHILFEIDKGEKVYFGKFTVVGNDKTRDKVVRRELNIYEGELYNHSKKERSREKIMALGFFDDVTFHQIRRKNADGTPSDVMDLEIRVAERSSTGTFMVSAGYNTYSGFIFMTQVQQRNFLGRGQSLTFKADISKILALYYLSFYEPYFLDSDWGLGADIYREKQEASSFYSSTTSYATTRTGSNIRLGYSMTDFWKFYTNYKIEYSKTTWDDSLSNIFNPDIENGITSSVTLTLEYDKRNDRFMPTKGFFSALSSEFAGLGGNKQFIKTLFDNRYYQPIFWGFYLRSRLLLGAISGYGDSSIPYSERFVMGGANTLRGFDYYSQGPVVYDSNGDPFTVGGTKQILFTTELEFDILKEAGIKGVFFFDYGNTFNKITSSLSTDVALRADWGFGFRWNSPMGPLRFEWGFPINKRPEEAKVMFQFMIGPPF